MTKKCVLRFTITANFLDEVEFDVIPIDICGIVLVSPYLCDRRDILHCHENKYHLFNNGIEYIVRAHNKKSHASLVNTGQIKRIVNASQNFAFLMIKHEDVEESKAFQGYESSLKSDFIDVSNSCDKMFQESNMLPPKIGKQNEVNSQQRASLLNTGVNKMSMLESTKDKNKMKRKITKEGIGSKTYSCGFHKVLALKRDGAWK